MLLKSPGMKGMYYYPPVLSDWCQMRAYENFQINLLENLSLDVLLSNLI